MLNPSPPANTFSTSTSRWDLPIHPQPFSPCIPSPSHGRALSRFCHSLLTASTLVIVLFAGSFREGLLLVSHRPRPPAAL
ncbi:hypothetical protein CBS147343_4450 [Aspergillus niger]|nr:hypothetical protein CBS147320_5257 [Aspergillus niger]KAI2960528.1 hypothetical protein CBS147322_493 [Aspergillus niger]KAI2969555.1 hypothetical protein CBS147324_5872 [Aspergillus niger]KAI2984589.1 hypothetical protein CBS147344_6910 [Aspergillus niger]KAI3051329.1 hypothetical protein CBS147352_5155 [Aspergillus niger]